MIPREDRDDVDPNTETREQPPERARAGSLPSRIGRYHVKRVIASGGMGTVYEATQEKPRRVVALKVMKHGIASNSALRRFEYESQILARLRHPGIAQVYEAGTHEDPGGTVPYFAMEYIPNAKPITHCAEEKRLGTRERLDLFVNVCDAVHHGHQKGIIHRDLKPGNILVDSHGQPRVIDFGVARSTDSDLAVTTLQTDVGQLIGTLQYMSPEQCEADPHDIDTRSDVYALGVVLYELLCGKPPYDVAHVAMYEATRVIREQNPTRPSTLNRALRGDAETIALKALEKDRERRYQSADELGRDIRRYLSGEPIVARPPSIIYQLRVFARRNKGLFAATAAVFVVLLGGVIVSTSLYLRAERARAETAVERDRALAAEQQATEERDRALAAEDRTAAINEFFKEMLGAVNPFQAGPRRVQAPATKVTVRELLQQAVGRVHEHFADQPELEAEVRESIAEAFFPLGLIKETEVQYRLALELRRQASGDDHPSTLKTMARLGMSQVNGNRFAEGTALIRSAYETSRRTRGPDHPETRDLANRLADSLAYQGKLAEAEAIFRELLVVCQRHGDEEPYEMCNLLDNLAWVLYTQGKLAEAELHAQRAAQLAYDSLGPDHIGSANTDFTLALLGRDQGRYAEAETLLREGTRKFEHALGVDHPYSPFLRIWFAGILGDKGELEPAEASLRETLEQLRRELGHHNAFTLIAADELTRVLLARGKFAEAERLCRELIDVYRSSRGAENPYTLDAMDGLAVALHGQGRLDEAHALSRQVVETAQRALPGGYRHIPAFHHHFGRCLLNLKRYDEAEEQLLAAYDGEFAMRGPQHKNTQDVMMSLATLYDAWGKPERAAQWQARLPAAQPQTQPSDDD